MTPETLHVEALANPFRGSLQVPPDKSISHRSVLFSAMAEGTSQITGALHSFDVTSTLNAVKALGAHVAVTLGSDDTYSGTITGWGAQGPHSPAQDIDCGNSGTTTRLLLGVLAPWNIEARLVGDNSLTRRPMKRVLDPLGEMGARFTSTDEGTLPITTASHDQLHGINYTMPMASAQVKSAILLAGLGAQGTTVITEGTPSRDHTERMLPGFGVDITQDSSTHEITLPGMQTLHASEVAVPGDISSAAFFMSAAAIREGSDLTLEHVNLNPTRMGCVSVLRRMGAHLSISKSASLGLEDVGDIHIVTDARSLSAIEVLPHEIPTLVDEIPVLALVAAHAEGTTVFRDISELRVKETDRAQAIVDGLSLCGVHAYILDNDLYIEGSGDVHWEGVARFESLGDHRLAMVWALAALCGGGEAYIDNFDAVGVSYPQFLHDIERVSR